MASTDKSPPCAPRLNGRRGAVQLLLSVVYLVIGASFLLIPQPESRMLALRWLVEILPLQPVAGLWILAAMVGAVSAFFCRPKDWVGFFALTFAPAVWGSLFLVGVLFGAPSSGIVSTVVYWAFAAVVMVVSGMQGPHDRDVRDVVL